MNAFKVQPRTTPEQSELLLKMGLKKETSDMTIATHNGTRPAWSLARLVEIAFDQNGPDSVIHLYRHSNPFDDVIGFIDYQIEQGLIKPEYLKQ